MTDPDPDALVAWSDDFLKSLDGTDDGGGPGDPVGRAMAATMRRWDIPREHVEAFIREYAS